MIFGYARVSTKEQNIEAQKKELQSLGCEKLFFEKATGKNMAREQLNSMLQQVRPGDLILITEISRLARSLKDLIFIMDIFSKKNIILQIGALKLDFTTPQGRLYASLFGAMAQFERELISQRTKRGLDNARINGIKGGRPKGISQENYNKALIAYKMRNLGNFKAKEIMKSIDIKSRATYSKYVRKIAYDIHVKTGSPLSDDQMSVLNHTGELGSHTFSPQEKYNIKEEKDS